jgi:N-carbamoyl-L-amino-acid hydrolase
VAFGSAVADLGVDPDAMGPDPERLSRLAAFIELHVEQGRALAPLGHALATGTGIDPHGRWRVTLEGSGDHAGTARLADRHDPMLVLAALIEAARQAAAEHAGVATIGRVLVAPNGSNVVPGQVLAWLDARAPEEATVRGIVATTASTVEQAGRREGVKVTITEESWTPAIRFDPALRARIETILDQAGSSSVALSTAAGHDAGVLAAHLPTAMLFVRNPTGISHAPAEGATTEDAVLGVRALAAVLSALAAQDA